jgi:hypothetical protein
MGATLRANLGVDRAFVRHGTSISTRLVVIDKVAGKGRPVIARTGDLARLAELAEAIAPRERGAGPDDAGANAAAIADPPKSGRTAIAPPPASHRWEGGGSALRIRGPA